MTPRTARLHVEGMTCDSCVSHVALALHEAGADDVRVDLSAGTATFAMEESLSPDTLAAAVSAAGYTPGSLDLLDDERRPGESNAPLVRDRSASIHRRIG